jgi:hypothetical protein
MGSASEKLIFLGVPHPPRPIRTAMARLLVLHAMLCALLAQLAFHSFIVGAAATSVQGRSTCRPSQCRCKPGAISVWGTDEAVRVPLGHLPVHTYF